MVVRRNKSWRDWGVLRSVRSCDSKVLIVESLLVDDGIVAARRVTRPVTKDMIGLMLLLLLMISICYCIVALFFWFYLEPTYIRAVAYTALALLLGSLLFCFHFQAPNTRHATSAAAAAGFIIARAHRPQNTETRPVMFIDLTTLSSYYVVRCSLPLLYHYQKERIRRQ